MLYPTVDGGQTWVSNWDRTPARSFGPSIDPEDPWFDTDHGDAFYSIKEGILTVTTFRGKASNPRMYIHDPDGRSDWGNVEITTYARRIADKSISYAGIMAYARTNHGAIGDEKMNLCDTRGYGGMLTYRGVAKFEKETAHGLDDGYAQVGSRTHWQAGMPFNQWVGYKFVVRDSPSGTVQMEIWVDESDRKEGGDWKRITDFEDDGTNFGIGYDSCCDPGRDGDGRCKAVVPPQMPLVVSDNRLGSETGRPNKVVYFRSDGVEENGLQYRWMSVREVEPL